MREQPATFTPIFFAASWKKVLHHQLGETRKYLKLTKTSPRQTRPWQLYSFNSEQVRSHGNYSFRNFDPVHLPIRHAYVPPHSLYFQKTHVDSRSWIFFFDHLELILSRVGFQGFNTPYFLVPFKVITRQKHLKLDGIFLIRPHHGDILQGTPNSVLNFRSSGRALLTGKILHDVT